VRTYTRPIASTEPTSADPTDRPVDRLVGGYLLVAALALLFPGRPEAWPVFLLVHLSLGGAFLAGGPGWVRRWALGRPPRSPAPEAWRAADATGAAGVAGPGLLRRGVAVIVDWYPLLIMPFLYWELPFLNTSLWPGRYFDGVIMGWEETIFGGQPSATLAMTWSSLLLSEVLHLAYLSYYFILYFFPAALYLAGRTRAFRETLFAFMVGFTSTYLVFIAFPVQGPRYLFPAPGGPPAEGALYALTHAVLESGSSRGAAFPSAHAALAVIALVQALRTLPRAAPLLAIATVGIIIGAVYGGFHYGIDMAAGALFGLVVAAFSPRLRDALS
jgi:membrane-associated phospholipid phosphatase